MVTSRWTLLCATVSLLGCGQTALTSSATAIDPPPCTTISQFGNGQTCAASDPSLASCGPSASRLCAGGWLCYDAPEYEQCACTADADCAGKREYVNQARALNDKSPVAISCHGGRCIEGQ